MPIQHYFGYIVWAALEQLTNRLRGLRVLLSSDFEIALTRRGLQLPLGLKRELPILALPRFLVRIGRRRN